MNACCSIPFYETKKCAGCKRLLPVMFAQRKPWARWHKHLLYCSAGCAR